MEKQENRWSE